MHGSFRIHSRIPELQLLELARRKIKPNSHFIPNLHSSGAPWPIEFGPTTEPLRDGLRPCVRPSLRPALPFPLRHVQQLAQFNSPVFLPNARFDCRCRRIAHVGDRRQTLQGLCSSLCASAYAPLLAPRPLVANSRPPYLTTSKNSSSEIKCIKCVLLLIDTINFISQQ